MASYDVNAYGARVKIRDTGVVVLLHIVTLGLYNLYWYFQINRELRDYGRVYRLESAGTNPWLSLLAVSLGWVLIIPPLYSWYRCTERIHEAQTLIGTDRLSGGGIAASFVGGLVITPVLLVIPFLVQNGLNKVWDAYRGLEASAAPTAQVGIGVGAVEFLPAARGWDLRRIGSDEAGAIEHFLLRRDGLAPGPRTRLATDLAARVRPLVPDAPSELDDERLLELIMAARDGGRGGAQVS